MADFRTIAGNALALTSDVAKAAAGAMRADAKSNGVAPRADGWMSTLTGVGAINQSRVREIEFRRDKRHTAESLASLFDGDWLAHKLCSIPPKDMFRRGMSVDIEGQDDLGDALTDRLETLRVGPTFVKGLSLKRCMGAAGIVLSVDDGQDFDKPIRPDAVKSVRWLRVYDRRSLRPINLDIDPRSDTFHKPQAFELRTTVDGQQREMEIHADRVIWIEDDLIAGPLDGDDCVSVLSRAYDQIRSHGYSWASVGEMIDQASVGVWKIDGLRGIAASEGQAAAEGRFAFATLAKSVLRALVLDKTYEDFEWRQLSLTGVPETMEGLSYLISGACDIPLTRLINRSPAGMNATGESDTRNYYDMVEAERTNGVVPGLERIVSLLFSETEGVNAEEPEVWRVQFPPLLQPTESEQRSQELQAAQMVVGLLNGGVIVEEEARSVIGPNGAIRSIELDDGLFEEWQANKPEPPDPNQPPPEDEESEDPEGAEEPEQ